MQEAGYFYSHLGKLKAYTNCILTSAGALERHLSLGICQEHFIKMGRLVKVIVCLTH